MVSGEQDRAALIEKAKAFASSTAGIAVEVTLARAKAHEKHGENSIEAIAPKDLRWLSILVEEVGKVSHELTYDAAGSLRAELIDVITVATAWVASLDRIDATEQVQS